MVQIRFPCGVPVYQLICEGRLLQHPVTPGRCGVPLAASLPVFFCNDVALADKPPVAPELVNRLECSCRVIDLRCADIESTAPMVAAAHASASARTRGPGP